MKVLIDRYLPAEPCARLHGLTLGVEELEIPVVGVPPAELTAGGLARDAELREMPGRAEGLKPSV